MQLAIGTIAERAFDARKILVQTFSYFFLRISTLPTTLPSRACLTRNSAAEPVQHMPFALRIDPRTGVSSTLSWQRPHHAVPNLLLLHRHHLKSFERSLSQERWAQEASKDQL